MDIEIIAVNVENKGNYRVADVSYKANGKTNGKKVMSFGNSEEAFKVISTARQGEAFKIDSVKNEKGFFDWVSAKRIEELPTQQIVKSSPTPRNTYETPEERALRQKLIVRQSSISNAIEYFKLVPKKTPDIQEILDVASQFERHVFGSKQEGLLATDDSSFIEMKSDISF